MVMETKRKEYVNGRIYCVRNTINNAIYIGSTCQKLSQRMSCHRSDMNKTKNQGMLLYKAMKELGKEHFYIELVEDYPCETIEQLRKRESEIARDKNAELNKNINGRPDSERWKDYYESHREERLQYGKEYRETHIEEIKQKKKDDYNTNKDKILKQAKEHREQNKELIKEQNQTQYIKHRDKILQRKKEHYEANKAEINARRREKNRFKRQNEKETT